MFSNSSRRYHYAHGGNFKPINKMSYQQNLHSPARSITEAMTKSRTPTLRYYIKNIVFLFIALRFLLVDTVLEKRNS